MAAHPRRPLGASLLLVLEDLAFLLLDRRAAPAPAPAPRPALAPPVTWHLPRDPFGRPN